MALDDKTKEAVEKSWKKVEGLGAETVGVLLFKNIFKIAPEALPLFSFKDEEDLYNSPKLKAHGSKVVTTVGTAVAGLRDLGTLVPVLQALGKRHVPRGVLAPHYKVVGDALIETLKGGLGDDFTPEVEEAWKTVYGVVADTMIGDNYLEMKVTTNKSPGFYAKSAISFFTGTEDKDGKKKEPVSQLKISGLGNSINAAVTAALAAESGGHAKITNIETTYPEMENNQRPCARILISLEAQKK